MEATRSRHLRAHRARHRAIGVVGDQRQVRLVLFQQIAGIMLRNDQHAAQYALTEVVEGGAWSS